MLKNKHSQFSYWKNFESRSLSIQLQALKAYSWQNAILPQDFFNVIRQFQFQLEENSPERKKLCEGSRRAASTAPKTSRQVIAGREGRTLSVGLGQSTAMRGKRNRSRRGGRGCRAPPEVQNSARRVTGVGVVQNTNIRANRRDVTYFFPRNRYAHCLTSCYQRASRFSKTHGYYVPNRL